MWEFLLREQAESFTNLQERASFQCVELAHPSVDLNRMCLEDVHFFDTLVPRPENETYESPWSMEPVEAMYKIYRSRLERCHKFIRRCHS